MGMKKYSNGFRVTLHPEKLRVPLSWRKPRMVFVNSMSDLFHEDVPEHFIRQVFNVMNLCKPHGFQILTKRADRMMSLDGKLQWGANIWMGVTVENADALDRIDRLRECGARVKFLSLEPLLGPLKRLTLDGIDWVIVGGESGPRARPIEERWVLDIRDKCAEMGVAFFFKQWGGLNKKKSGWLLQGRTYDELPGSSEDDSSLLLF
jgi:protein gp37